MKFSTFSVTIFFLGSHVVALSPLLSQKKKSLGIRRRHQSVEIQVANSIETGKDEESTPKEAVSPKTSLETVRQSHTAKPWILKLVEHSHWASLLPALIACYAIFSNANVWYDYFGNEDLRVMSWMLAPVIMFASGLPTMTMHAYEDWQIAPARDPTEESFQFNDFNNQRLRGVATNMLFVGISASYFATIYAYVGTNSILPIASLVACSSLRKERASSFLPKEYPDRDLVAPVPAGSILLVIVSSVIVWIGLFLDLSNHIPEGNTLLKFVTILGNPLIGLGGIYEGVVGETQFNQWDHEIASLLVFAGYCALACSFFGIGDIGLI